MDKILLINADEPEEVRVAVVEDGRLEEVYLEAGSDPTGKGNIFVGRVQNVERGIGAAFVDLGGGVTGFLHASDVADPPSELGDVDETVVAAPRRRRRKRGATGGGGEPAGSPDARAEGDDETRAVGAPEAPRAVEAPAAPGVPPAELGPERHAEGQAEGHEAAAASGRRAPPPRTPTVLGEAEGDAEGAPWVEGEGAVASPADAPEPPEDAGEGTVRAPAERAAPRRRGITDLVKPGDVLLVQVSRGPVGQKGPTLTTRISLPGRYCVLLANSTRSGVSRRIGTGEERSRMRALLGDLAVPDGMAVILRTASNGRAREEVQADLIYLYRLWENLKARLLEGGGARLVHEESDLVSRAIRDILPPDCARIVTDDAPTAERIREYLLRTAPALPAGGDGAPPASAPSPTSDAAASASPPPSRPGASGPDAPVPPSEDRSDEGPAERPDEALDAPPAPPVEGSGAPRPALRAPPSVEVHPGPTPLFHAFGIEAQIEDAFRRTIRLPSGGSIVIDPTEALVAIDVNSGRMTEEEDLESTALKTDLEAVPEIARQLRLRDLGGVIVIDFIDLRDHGHMREVERALRDALRRDRARIRLGRMGPFGCLELTRQRIRPALLSVTHVECPTCGGAGRRRHPFGLALRVLRELRARAARSRGHGGLEVRVPPPIADLLRKRKAASLAALDAWLTGPFRLVPDASLPYGGWSVKGLPPKSPVPRAGAGLNRGTSPGDPPGNGPVSPGRSGAESA